MRASLKKVFKTKPIRRESVEFKGHSYWLNYIPTKIMHEAHLSGVVYREQAYISNDLKGSVKRFVTQHELYHLVDKQNWLGYFGKELRSNTACGIKDPLGLIATIVYALRKGNLKAYVKALLTNMSK